MTAPLALGIDIGGTRLRAALVDRAGVLHARREVLTAAREGPQVIISQIAELAAEVLQGVARSDLAGAGVCCPGPLDTEQGIALGIPTLSGFNDVPIAKMIGEALDLPLACLLYTSPSPRDS